MLKRNILRKIALLLSLIGGASWAQQLPKTQVYGFVYQWTLPKTIQEQELIIDFKKIADLAAQQGASSSHLYRGASSNEYIGIEFWPSKELYSNWFDQKTFRFRKTQPQEVVDLIKKIQEVYKNKLLTEITQQII